MLKFKELHNIRKIILGITLLGVISYLFFPIISYHFDEVYGYGSSETIFEFYGDSPFDRFGFNFGNPLAVFGIVVSIIAIAVTVLFIFKQNNCCLMVATIISMVGIVLFYISVNAQVGEINRIFNAPGYFSSTDFLGIGFWFDLISVAANVCLSIVLNYKRI